MAPMLLLLLAGQALSFPQALELAEQTPAVTAELEAAERRADLAGEVSSMPFNPVVQLQPGGRAFQSGGQGFELYLSLLQRFSLGGLGKHRRTALRRELEHDHALHALVLRHTRRDVADAWLATWIATRAHAVAHEEVELADQLIAQTRAAVSAQEATNVELAGAQSWRAEAMLSVLAFEGEEFDAGLALAKALGDRAAAPRAVLDELPVLALPAVATLEASREQVDANVDVLVARSEQAVASARLAETRAARSPTMALGAMAWREGAGDIAAVATIEAEIPVFEKGERERAPIAADEARARGREELAIVEAQAERAQLLHELRHTQGTLNVAERELLVAAEALAEAQRLRLAAHEATVSEWVLSRRGVLAARLAVLRAQANHQRARFLTQEAWRDVAMEKTP